LQQVLESDYALLPNGKFDLANHYRGIGMIAALYLNPRFGGGCRALSIVDMNHWISGDSSKSWHMLRIAACKALPFSP
jgi:hypothetical protein